ncbi:5187_t:CDS:2 [Ambispora leptoticha]|uniref:5187_t:CDS:1 n=1 Tax=Ambispora leptoticha TaxID=144679 RepID=A0A9N8ZP13_9GLOM|nr:5187_t:CDS:2 [Ambispora leptoticha]
MHTVRNKTYIPIIHSPLAPSTSVAQLPTPSSSLLCDSAQSRISSRYTNIVKPAINHHQRFNGKKFGSIDSSKAGGQTTKHQEWRNRFKKECAERIKASRDLTVSQRRRGLSEIQGVVDAEQSIQEMWMQFQKQHALHNLWYDPEDYEELLQEIAQESVMYDQQEATATTMTYNDCNDMMIDDDDVDNEEKEIEFAIMMDDEEYLINNM